MQSSNCIREASKACFNSCCANPHSPAPPSAAAPRRDFVSAILSTLHPSTTFTNHESLPSSRELLSSLRDALPNYFNSVLADSIRAQEYYHFNLSNHVCLDYVGHGLFSYAQKLLPASTSAPPPEERFFDFAYSSTNFTSYLLYGGEEQEFHAAAKRRIFRYMNVSEDDYSVVFTANQSSAFKLLAQSYPFGSQQNLVSLYDYDNEALQVMVEAAGKRGGRPQSAVFSWPTLRVNSRKLRKILMNKNRGLLAFPLQSRMSGARYSYQWMNLARENGWHVLLDASALAAKEMETLGLSLFQPDFLICSFFKIFGENPSGFCCLFVKKSSISVLNQSSTNMGIINLVPPRSSAIDEELHSTPSSSSEEVPSSEIVEVHGNKNALIEFRGLDHADTLGLILISSRLRYLVNWVVNALLSLRHPHSGNGLPLVTLYGPRVRLDRGPALAFNVCDWKGEMVEPVLVQKLADRNNISLSIGFLKNICFGEDKKKMDCGVGVVSASLGMLTNFEDVYRFWAFVARFLDADFVEKERWRYTALNQTTVEV
ncbi:uncharacterized protein LOC131026226 [Salvia miltiorrhiza]|uniref:uncharacterized protein LOC131026226 n=1 Tax=Salvia miltiorrhiza TaxID=226208 RepID=UPI0025AB7559|nr:uncharacterized protein LOC131026226 [Salvia miltiorrhiza]